MVSSRIFFRIIIYLLLGHVSCVLIETVWWGIERPEQLYDLFKIFTDTSYFVTYLILPGITLGSIQFVLFGLVLEKFNQERK